MWNPSSSKLWIWLASRTWKVRNSTEALYVHCDACNLTRLICHHGEMSLVSFNKIKNRVKHEIYIEKRRRVNHTILRKSELENDLIWSKVSKSHLVPLYTYLIHPSHKCYNAVDKYPTMHHFVAEMCTFMSQNCALWDLGEVHYGICEIGLLTLNVRGPSYLGLTRSISWLLMPWLLTSPGHQQPWYWLCSICRSWSYLRMDFK